MSGGSSTVTSNAGGSGGVSGEGGGGESGGAGGSGAGGSGGAVDALPACDARSLLDATTMPSVATGSGQYAPAGSNTIDLFRALLGALIDGDAGAALSAAAGADYAVCRDGDVSLARPRTNNGRAWLLLRDVPSRDVVLGVPHAFHEPGTLHEAKVIFDLLGARAVIATSTHRCAAAMTSSCDGTTMVCDAAAAPYRISDMAHNDATLFQVAHEALLLRFAMDTVISLHGMVRQGVSVSNGSSAPTDPTTPVALLTEAIAMQLPMEQVTTCNDYGAGNHDVHLCGTTNIQGRLVHESPNACVTPAAANDRFVHLEQHADIRAQPMAIALALDAALP